MAAGDYSGDGENSSSNGGAATSSGPAVGDGSGCSLPSQFGSGNCPVSSNSVLARPTSLPLPSLTFAERGHASGAPAAVDGDHKLSHQISSDLVMLPHSTAVLTPITPTMTLLPSCSSTFGTSNTQNLILSPSGRCSEEHKTSFSSVPTVKVDKASPVSCSNFPIASKSLGSSGGGSMLSPNLLSPCTPNSSISSCTPTNVTPSLLSCQSTSNHSLVPILPCSQRSSSHPDLSKSAEKACKFSPDMNCCYAFVKIGNKVCKVDRAILPKIQEIIRQRQMSTDSSCRMSNNNCSENSELKANASCTTDPSQSLNTSSCSSLNQIGVESNASSLTPSCHPLVNNSSSSCHKNEPINKFSTDNLLCPPLLRAPSLQHEHSQSLCSQSPKNENNFVFNRASSFPSQSSCMSSRPNLASCRAFSEPFPSSFLQQSEPQQAKCGPPKSTSTDNLLGNNSSSQPLPLKFNVDLSLTLPPQPPTCDTDTESVYSLQGYETGRQANMIPLNVKTTYIQYCDCNAFS